MFWQSIVNGLIMMITNWEIWISIGVYIVLYVIYFSGSAFLIMNVVDKHPGWVLLSFSLNSILGTAIVGILIAFMIAFLLPVLFHNPEFTSMTFLIENWWFILKIGLFSGATVLILSFLPIIGKIISGTPGVSVLMQCIMSFYVFSSRGISSILNDYHSKIDIYPGFFTVVVFFVISWLLFIIMFFTISLLLKRFHLINEDSTNPMLGIILAIIPGILCLCFYSSFVDLALLNVIKQ